MASLSDVAGKQGSQSLPCWSASKWYAVLCPLGTKWQVTNYCNALAMYISFKTWKKKRTLVWERVLCLWMACVMPVNVPVANTVGCRALGSVLAYQTASNIPSVLSTRVAGDHVLASHVLDWKGHKCLPASWWKEADWTPRKELFFYWEKPEWEINLWSRSQVLWKENHESDEAQEAKCQGRIAPEGNECVSGSLFWKRLTRSSLRVPSILRYSVTQL